MVVSGAFLLYPCVATVHWPCRRLGIGASKCFTRTSSLSTGSPWCRRTATQASPSRHSRAVGHSHFAPPPPSPPHPRAPCVGWEGAVCGLHSTTTVVCRVGSFLIAPVRTRTIKYKVTRIPNGPVHEHAGANCRSHQTVPQSPTAPRTS